MEFDRGRYLKQLLEREHNGLIKVITGMRRSGKSFLLNELFYRTLIEKGISEGQIIRFAFDMDEDIDLLESYFPDEPTRVLNERHEYVINARKFRAFIREHTRDTEPYYLLLDEVQLLEGFTGTKDGLEVAQMVLQQQHLPSSQVHLSAVVGFLWGFGASPSYLSPPL